MPSRHLTSTVATRRRCPQCRAVTLAGISEGWLVRVDPTPLTPAGADALTAAGRDLYVLSHRELVHRDDDHTQLSGLVLPEHVCTTESKEK